MEKYLTRFMARALQPLLAPLQYSRLMGQLEKAFRPYRPTGRGGVLVGGDLEQLQTMYLYLQAAVVGRQLREVVAAIHNLINASRSPG
jgi:hypothetical protein